MLICIKCLKSQQTLGGVAHMVERSLRMREARGSIPRTSIFFYVLPLQFAHKVIILVPLFFFLQSFNYNFVFPVLIILLHSQRFA